MGKYDINYYECPSCFFVQTESPYWLEESYSSAISDSDTGIFVRNNYYSKVIFILMRLLGLTPSQKFLDYGGGHGIFVRLMRDRGLPFFWSDKYSQNHYARGFEAGTSDKYEAVTAIETAEHWLNPEAEISRIFGMTDTIIMTTELTPTQSPDPQAWWYFCLEHGQHISLFSKKSLEILAHQHQAHLVTNGYNLHIISKKKISPLILKLARLVQILNLDYFLKLPSLTESDRLKVAGDLHV